MSDQLPVSASPDQRAECGRCGAIVRVARIGRHEREHEWADELERRVQVLEDSGGEAELVQFGEELEAEPWPSEPPAQAPTEPVAVPPHEEPAPADDADLRHFSRF